MGKDAGSDAAKAQAYGNMKAQNTQRRQFDDVKGLLNPFISAGQDALSGVTEGAGLGGFADRLNEIMGGSALDPLREKRLEAINSQFGKAGLLNSGGRATAIADDLTDFSMAIENMLYGRENNIMASGQNAAMGLGGFGQSMANNVSQMQSNTGQAIGSGIIGDAQSEAAMMQQLLGFGGAAAGGAAAGASGLLGSGIGAGGGAALGLMFSDGRLKENLRSRGTLGPLTVYEWDWIPELKALGIEPDMTVGFIAEDVEQVFPRYVHKVGNFKAVDYQGLMDKLEEVIH